jgi:hypothetical protein
MDIWNSRLDSIAVQSMFHVHRNVTTRHDESHSSQLAHYIVTFLVTVDGVLDWQLDLLDQLLQHVVTLYSSL